MKDLTINLANLQYAIITKTEYQPRAIQGFSRERRISFDTLLNNLKSSETSYLLL